MNVDLRPLDRADLPALLTLRNRWAAAPPWTADQLAAELFDGAHRAGVNLRVAWRDGAPRGLVGWVDFAAPAEFYGVPMIAADHEAAAALVAHVVGVARVAGAGWLRVSAYPGEATKRAALAAAGFRAILDFVTVVADARVVRASATPPTGWSALPPDAAIDFAELAALDRRCFAAVPNSPPAEAALLAEAWPDRWAEASALWRDERGRYAAWAWVTPEGVISSIGVDPEAQRAGVGRALVGHVAYIARRRGRPRLEAVIAEVNAASLGLFRALGFVDDHRRTVFQLDLDR